MPFPLVPVIAAGTSILSTAMQGSQSASNVGLSYDANKKLAEQAYARDVEQWHRQNEYNSPEAQMARYREAKLNPNLIYSQGSPGNATSSPSYHAPTADYRGIPSPVDPASAFAEYQDAKLRQAQIDNVEANTANVDARTVNEGIRSSLIDMMKVSTATKTAKTRFDLESGKLRRPDELKKLALEAERKGFDLDVDKVLLPYQGQIAENRARVSSLEVQKLLSDLFTQSQDQILKSIQARYEEKKLSQMDIKGEIIQADALFKRYQNEFMKAGITSSDHPLLRMFIRAFNEGEIKFDTYKMQQDLNPPRYRVPGYK